MSTKCKMFMVWETMELEEAINDFLEKNSGIEILKVKQLFDPDETDLIISVFYKEPKAVKT
jgi:hypothetical protein